LKFELQQQLGKYPLVREIGSGATSSVYLARDPFKARDVAIKVYLFDRDAHPQDERMKHKAFVAEASLAGTLAHPHIVEIYDAVVEPDHSYLVMEYVPGTTLEAHAGVSTLLPLHKVVEIIFKSIRALEYAFQHGIIHRDIKPGNILLSQGGETKVSDFGASFQHRPGHTTTQVAGIGSPAYMSPEQVKDLPLDHRTDIYSMGVVMYHLLAGRLPFLGPNNYSLIYQITNAEAEPAATFRPGIPAAVEAIVQRAMAKDLAKRYAQWDDFSADLAAAFRSEHFGARRAQEFADSDRFETLRRLPFFENFSDAELWEVARISTWRHAPAGETLMQEGEPGDYFCILAQGEVKVTKRGKLLNLLRAGEPFGEMTYLSRNEQARGADVTVAADASIISVPTRRLNQASESCRHKFDRAFMEILVERLAMANLRLSGV
jgi:eukaryotic-like serine/threonine-protein kinase